MKRSLLLATAVAGLVVVVGVAAGCPTNTPQGGCTQNSDCDDGAVCAAGNCVDVTDGEGDGPAGEGEGEGPVGEGEGEGEGEEGEGEEGEGEGEGDGPPPDPVFRLEADVVTPAVSGTSGALRLSGGPVLNAPQVVLRGSRFTLRGATVGGAR